MFYVEEEFFGRSETPFLPRPLFSLSVHCSADFVSPHQGDSHLFRSFVISSSLPPRCVLLSFGFLIGRRLSSDFWSLLAFILARAGMLFFISLLHKFVIFFSQFVIRSFFFLSLYKSSRAISNGSVEFFSHFPSEQGTWMMMFFLTKILITTVKVKRADHRRTLLNVTSSLWASGRLSVSGRRFEQNITDSLWPQQRDI